MPAATLEWMAMALRWSSVMGGWSTRRGAMRGSQGYGRLEASVPGEEVALGWRGAASVFFRRARLVAPVLLQIREKVKGKWLDKMRRMGGIRGSGNDGNLTLMASRRSSPARSPGA
jgi:hypothetical protein